MSFCERSIGHRVSLGSFPHLMLVGDLGLVKLARIVLAVTARQRGVMILAVCMPEHSFNVDRSQAARARLRERARPQTFVKVDKSPKIFCCRCAGFP
ncbi:hypothetical protein ABIF68_001638 [Bradyrhizobium japonicum]